MSSSPEDRGLDLDRFRPPKPGPAAVDVTTVPTSAVGAGGPFSVVARERRVREILAGIENLPSLPTVVMKAIRLTGDAEANAADFEEVIRNDQALAARVLKLANSPFFGLRGTVTSIAQAVVVLGLKTMRSVVIAARTSKLLNRKLPPYGFDETGMWKHSVSTAMVARFLARHAKLGADTTEELFVAGLLHDVGKTILTPHVRKFQDEFLSAVRSGGDVVRAETELIGISHPDVGARMADQWNLDRRLRDVIAKHHDNAADGPANDDTRRLVTVQLANDLCHQLGIGRASGPREASPAYDRWLAVLGLDGDGLLETVDARLHEMRGVFESMAGG